MAVSQQKPSALKAALKAGNKPPVVEVAVPAPETAANAPSRLPASRIGKRALTVHVPEDVHKQVKHLAVEQGRPDYDVVNEGLNLVFAMYGKPECAPRKKPRGS